MPKFQIIKQRIKELIKDSPFLEILLYFLAKFCFSLLELPHDSKQSTYIPYLCISLLLALAAIALKFRRHKFRIVSSLLRIQTHAFLLWIITTIYIIFTWSLCDAIGWSLVEKILIVLCQISMVFMLTLLTDEQFISNMQFIGYEVILGLQILFVSIKTVGFIKYNSESPHKDIVLLCLTTQIALMIVLMDVIEKSHSKMKKNEIQEDMTRFENQMVLTNRVTNSRKSKPEILQTLEITS